MALSCLFSRDLPLCDRCHLVQKVTSSHPCSGPPTAIDLTLLCKKKGPPVWRWDRFCGWDSCFRAPHGVRLKPDPCWAPQWTAGIQIPKHSSASSPDPSSELDGAILLYLKSDKWKRVADDFHISLLLVILTFLYVYHLFLLLILYIFFAFISVGLFLPPYCFLGAVYIIDNTFVIYY